MFKYVKGKIVKQNKESIILESNGFGFEIFCSPKTISRVKKGEIKTIYTYLYIKKEEMELYGFLDEKELEFFQFLNKIPGIGPKTASFFASWKNPEKLKEYLEKSSIHIKGVGRKKIQKILLEITGRIREIKKGVSEKDKELIEALYSLGVPKSKAREILSKLPPEKDVQKRIKIALRMINK